MQKSLITNEVDCYTLFSREGNKNKYKTLIISQFPSHYKYIEPFFGTGAIFFNKPLAPYNVVNDSSKTIYDFYNLFKDEDKLNEFVKKFEYTLTYNDIIVENLDKLEYKMLSIITTMFNNSGNTLKNRKAKPPFIERLRTLQKTYMDKLKNTIIFNKDIFDFFKAIEDRTKMSKNTLIYLDPPYSIQKGRLNDNKGWSIEKLKELLDLLKGYQCKYCISEMDNKKIIDLFKKYNLNIKVLSKAMGLNAQFKTGHSEIIATNY